jgi:hypothetical protein
VVLLVLMVMGGLVMATLARSSRPAFTGESGLPPDFPGLSAFAGAEVSEDLLEVLDLELFGWGAIIF